MLLIESIDSLIEEQINFKKVSKVSSLMVGILGKAAAATIFTAIILGQNDKLPDSVQVLYDSFIVQIRSWVMKATQGNAERDALVQIKDLATEVVQKAKDVNIIKSDDSASNIVEQGINALKKLGK